MIGVCLPWKWICGVEEEKTSAGSLLRELKSFGVHQIELDLTDGKIDEKRLLLSARWLLAENFKIAVRISVTSSAEERRELFTMLERLSALFPQEPLTTVIHACMDDISELAEILAELAAEKESSFLIAVEHSPKLPIDAHDEVGHTVLDLVSRIGLSHVGICFDRDAALAEWSARHPDGMPFELPEKDFWKHVKHAHIGKTDECSLKACLSAFCYCYYGSYNVQLKFDRKTEFYGVAGSINHAVTQLKAVMPHCARVYDDLRFHFDEKFMQALSVFDPSAKGCRFSLITSSSFLFQTNGFRWAMDVAFRNAYLLAQTPHGIAEWLADVELMVISHGHADHFEERTVRTLATTKMRWVIPDFLVDTALAWGIRADKMLIAHADEPICVGPLTITPFHGRHFRPVTGKGTQEYGYRITAEGAPSLAFPVDTRDFSLEGLPDLPLSDYCFANIWLGDHGGLTDPDPNMIEEYTRFMLRFSQKHLIFAHLYESKRKDEDMWRREHAELISQTVADLSPSTMTHIPNPGEIWVLY